MVSDHEIQPYRTAFSLGQPMTQWLLGTAGILVGTFIVVVGNSDELNRIALFRRFGWGIVVIAILLLVVTLVNEVALPVL
jgi:hypothetical protein